MATASRIANWPAFTVAGLILILASGVQAGPRDHLDGFFLRLSAGAGSSTSRIEQGADFIEMSGSAGEGNIAIGGIVAPNLALHGTLFGWSISDPDVETRIDSGKLPGDLTASALGVGLTYYFMPANLYLSGSVGSGSMTVDVSGGPGGDTDSGLMFDLTLGKEWWVGDKWGLGAALGLTHHSFGDPDVDANWSGTSFALRFTATMN